MEEAVVVVAFAVTASANREVTFALGVVVVTFEITLVVAFRVAAVVAALVVEATVEEVEGEVVVDVVVVVEVVVVMVVVVLEAGAPPLAALPLLMVGA